MFSDECNKLRSTFLNLNYPSNFINSAINKFFRNIDNIDAAKNTRDDRPTIMVPLPFKEQQSANSVKRQMQILSANIGVQMKPVFQTKETKRRSPLLLTINAWATNLNATCSTQIMSGTPPDIYTSALIILQSGGILRNMVYRRLIWIKKKQFSVLKKCRSKFNCLIFGMLFIKALNRE